MYISIHVSDVCSVCVVSVECACEACVPHPQRCRSLRAGIYTISTSLSLKQIYYLDHCIELSSYRYPVPRLPIIEVSSSSESHFSR